MWARVQRHIAGLVLYSCVAPGRYHAAPSSVYTAPGSAAGSLFYSTKYYTTARSG
jgi:hypothetical protein